MSSTPTGRRRRLQEFHLPDGKKVIAALPEDLDTLRQKYSNSEELQVEVVVHGSTEHADFLRQSQSHHESRRARFRQEHGPAFAEWEDCHQQLNSVSAELERLSRQTTGLDVNFNKFGYDAGLRTYDDDNEGGVASSSNSLAESSSDGHSGNSRLGATVKLIKKPVVKQWFHKGLLWRASEQTEIMAIELFFDLLYVGIIHTNGEHMAEEPTGQELQRFAITFIMTWKIWTEITTSISWFETDDIFTRLEILFDIACLLGFTTNMINSFNQDEAHNTYTQLVAFYLASRFKCAVHYAITSYLLPMIRGVMITSVINILVPAVLWIVSTYVGMPGRLGLIWTALLLDMYGHVFFLSLFQYAQRVGEKSDLARKLNKFFEFHPAMNIEHKVERTNAFVSLVLGYSVVGILFQSNGGYNVNAFLGKAVLGLLQAFIFNWIYFDVDAFNLNIHAIRRHWTTAALWNVAHLPMVMGYIIATSALSRLVLATDVMNTNPEQLTEKYQALAEHHYGSGVRFFYCHGLAIALLSMAAISLSHDHRIPINLRWSKNWRLANRLVVCVIMFFLPLAHSLRSLHLIAITTSMVAWVLIVELWGKSCRDDPFIGEREGCCVKYFAQCSKKDLARATASGTLDVVGIRKADILEVSSKEKTAIPV